MTHKSRTDTRTVFKLGSKVGHVTRHTQQLFKVKRSEVKVTKSRDVSADKNAVTRQWMVISTSKLVEIINMGVDACGRNMADIHNIKCKNQRKTSPNRRNFVL